MWQNAHDAYLESRILSADPLELVRMLYQTCIGSVREARRHLAEGDIGARCRCTSKAFGILTELTCSLDHERGGDLSQRLAKLYDYMQRKILEANFQQNDAPLAEVLGLLSTLSEGWDGIRESSQPVEQAESPWSQPMLSEPTPELATHGWSL
ncbi:Flagellar protein FliS [Candidatus Sulfopaludibacter sp. SbA3]|nr:Flagellar protein FliS [Candidatus Sulfopaludibacter sp. SbA3]